MVDTDNKIEELGTWDFPNRKQVPDGYYLTEVVTATDANFQLLVEEHNKLVRIVNSLTLVSDG